MLSRLSQLMMMDCRVMGHSRYVGGDSSALHHRLSTITEGEHSLLPVAAVSALLSDQFISLKAPLYAGVSVKINNVSDADSNSYGRLLHGSAAEGCRNAASPPQATGRKLR